MPELIRCTASHSDFQKLVAQLDADLAQKNGEAHDFFNHFNQVDQIKNVVVAYEANQPCGCGAIKAYNASTMEVKRMFVLPHMRGRGIAAAVLQALEAWAKELGYTQCILETGDKMQPAINLYKKSEYQIIPNYGPYKNVESSVCFQKNI